MQERKSLLAMKQLLDHTVEVLALWKVLCDHQLHLLGQSLSAEMRMSLKTTLFRDLILSGSDTCIGLVNSSSIDTWMMRPGRMPSVRN
jgi:nuclear pore complex protein Nup155